MNPSPPTDSRAGGSRTGIDDDLRASTVSLPPSRNHHAAVTCPSALGDARHVLVLTLLLGALLVDVARAAEPATQAVSPPSAPSQRSQANLEELVKPIALHPDPLIAVILPAAVYPLEIVQAARFLKDTNNLSQLDQQPWDDNVKALAKFPAQLSRMDADLAWTVELGQAFLEQPKELMDAIQNLRTVARKAGTLQTTTQQVVTVTNVVILQTNVTHVVNVTNQIVQVQPADPQVVYVPTYPPTVYYPPPSYVYDPYAPLVTFGVGIAVGAIIANNCDWHGGGIYVGGGGMVIWGGGGHHGDVDIDINNNVNIDRGARPTPQSGNRTQGTGTRATTTQQKWQPDQNRLRTSGAGTAAPSAGTREARGWGSPSARPTTPSTGLARPGPSTGAVGQRPSTGTSVGGRPAASTGVTRASPTPAPSVNRASPAPSSTGRTAPGTTANRGSSTSRSGNSAFSGMNSGGSARNFSNRGAASRGGGGGFRGGGGRR